MIDNKKIMEAVVGGIFFGSIYFLCKFQVALEMDGNNVDPSSTMGQAFWFAKVFLAILAAKFVGQELVTLIEKTWPMVQASVNAQVESGRPMDEKNKTEERMTGKDSDTQRAKENSDTQKAKEDHEGETSPRHRRSTAEK